MLKSVPKNEDGRRQYLRTLSTSVHRLLSASFEDLDAVHDELKANLAHAQDKLHRAEIMAEGYEQVVKRLEKSLEQLETFRSKVY